MGKKGKKTRWRRLPIGGADEEGGLSLEAPPPATDHHRVTFNEDEYTKITTPRQDVLFKKGYFGRKRTPNPTPSDTQEVHSGDSVESESYVCEEPQYAYSAGYMDPSGVYYVNGNTYETYDPYTGTVTVVVGPPAQYPGGAPVLAALPCQPVPLQPVEWFNPAAPWCYSYSRRKRSSTDSQNCSAQSSESTGPPGSPQEPVEEGACAMYPPQYVYPGYMFGPPIYNMNGVTVQGVIPQPVPLQPDLCANKRRKKRRRRRRGGMTDDGSESSCCEEPLTCDVPGCQSETSSDAVCQSGASSDAGAGPGSISSKANSDSGINTDPTPNSGSNSPPLHIVHDPPLAQETEPVNNIQFECSQQEEDLLSAEQSIEDNQLSVSSVAEQTHILPLCSNHECVTRDDDRSHSEMTTPEEISEELSVADDDITPNLCAAAPEFSSQESTLSCLSTPSVTRDLLLNENEVSNVDVSQDEIFESCQSLSETVNCIATEHIDDDLAFNNPNEQSMLSVCPDPILSNNDLKTFIEENKENAETLNEDQDLICNGEIENVIRKSQIIDDESESVNSVMVIEASPIFEEEEEIEMISYLEDNCVAVIEPEYIAATASRIEENATFECGHPFSRFSPYNDVIAPVPPPRRKRSMCRAADKLASKIVEEAIREGMKEAACLRLKSPMSITEAVTLWLNSQGSSPLTCPVSDSNSETDDDEGIEVEEGSTDQKNVQGNPFLVSSHSGAGQRVAKDCESIESSAGEWDLWDHNHTREMCDPTRSVDKYYRLGADDGVGDQVPPSVFKTAMHIRHTGPFPCGVCCIIQ